MIEWNTVLAIVGTLLGGLVTALTSATIERKRRESEDQREVKRNQREDDAAKKSATLREREADAANGDKIASLFYEGRIYVTNFNRDEDGHFNEYFNSKWDGEFEKQLRMLIGRLRDNGARNRLVTIMDALLDFEPLSPFSGAANEERFLSDTFILGAELALAIAREQEPEVSVIKQFDALSQSVDAWNAFLDQQAEERAQSERKRLQRKREQLHQYRMEEARVDALSDLEAELREEEGED